MLKKESGKGDGLVRWEALIWDMVFREVWGRPEGVGEVG